MHTDNATLSSFPGPNQSRLTFKERKALHLLLQALDAFFQIEAIQSLDGPPSVSQIDGINNFRKAIHDAQRIIQALPELRVERGVE